MERPAGFLTLHLEEKEGLPGPPRELIGNNRKRNQVALSLFQVCLTRKENKFKEFVIQRKLFSGITGIYSIVLRNRVFFMRLRGRNSVFPIEYFGEISSGSVYRYGTRHRPGFIDEKSGIILVR
jgi:hypothetical protein